MKSSPIATLDIIDAPTHHLLRCGGKWTLNELSLVIKTLESLTVTKPLHWEITLVDDFDSAGVALWSLYSRKFLAQGFASELIGGREEHLRLHRLLYPHPSEDTPPPKQHNTLYRLGEATHHWFLGFDRFLHFLGEAFVVFLHSLIHPTTIRYRSIGSNIITAGFDALPIIAVSSFLIGVVVAFQSVVQLDATDRGHP